MGNLLQYTDKSKTIDNKLALILSQIQHDYENGEIRTETEYYYRIKTMITDFYNSLNKPSFEFRPAVFAPISSDYNAMITEAYGDMQYIINDCQSLSSNVKQSFTDAELNRTMMTNEIAYLTQQVDNIIENITLNQSSGVVIFTELFNNKDTMGNLQDDKSCTVHVTEGILTLPYYDSSKIEITNAEIDETVSNGFPGNTHCVDTLNKDLHFIGQDGLHNKIKAIHDNNLDTWFEYELFSIPDAVRQECNNYGFSYAEDVSWVSDGPLKLKLNIYTNSSDTCSWISLKPYLSDIKGIKNCIIEKCDIVTSDNNVYQVATNISFDDVKVLMFPAKPVQRIELTLIQNSWYNAKVGHYYYSKVNTKSMSIFQDYDTTDIYSRVEGEQPSVNLLGVKYNPSTQWIEYGNSNTEYPTDAYVKDKLFTLPASTIELKAGQEIVDAYRYMIGIRNIYAKSYVFSEYGEYISNKYTTEECITAISLETKEYIPGNNPDVLKYYLTFDGGVNWHQIYPMHRAYEGIYRYTINTDTIANLMTTDNTRIKKSKNINLLLDAYSFQLKITMERPKDVPNPENSTPVVYQYKLIVETGGENIEY